MDEFLQNTKTIITQQGANINNRVEYGEVVPNTMLVFIDETGGSTTGFGFAIYNSDKVDLFLNNNGELIIRSFDDEEAANYSIDEEGNLIYTF